MKRLILLLIATLLGGVGFAQSNSILGDLYNTSRKPVQKVQKIEPETPKPQSAEEILASIPEDMLISDEDYYPGLLKNLLDEGVYVPENLANIPATVEEANESEMVRLVYVPTWAEPYAMNQIYGAYGAYMPTYISWNMWYNGPYSRPFRWTYNGYRPWYSMWDPWFDPMPPYAYGWGGYWGSPAWGGYWGGYWGPAWGGYPPHRPGYRPGYYPQKPPHRNDGSVVRGSAGRIPSTTNRVYATGRTSSGGSRFYRDAVNTPSGVSPVRGTPVRGGSTTNSSNNRNDNRSYTNIVRDRNNTTNRVNNNTTSQRSYNTNSSTRSSGVSSYSRSTNVSSSARRSR